MVGLWTGDDRWDETLEWHVRRRDPDGTWHVIPPAYDTEAEAEARVAELEKEVNEA